jgi:hypothetical protein
LAQIGAEYGLKPSLLMLTAKTGRPRESIVGSGQFGTPRERMQCTKLRSWFNTCRTRVWGQASVFMHCSTEPTLIVPRCFGATEVVEPRAFLELSKAADGRLPPQAAVNRAKAAAARRIAAARTM